MTSEAQTTTAAQPETNGLGIASMVLGILWLGCLGSLLAVILGHVSLGQIKRSKGTQSGRGFAVAGLVLGYVGIGLAALAVVVVFATVTVTARDADQRSKTAACVKELAQIRAAEEAVYDEIGYYVSEGALVGGGELRRPSESYDIVVDKFGGPDYRIVGRGSCS